MREPTDPELIEKLIELSKTDHNHFMDLVLESIKAFPEIAIEDDSEPATKLQALQKVIRHFENREEYEDCAFIHNLQQRIRDAAER